MRISRDYDSLSKEDVFENNKLVSESCFLLVLIITILQILQVEGDELDKSNRNICADMC